MKERKTRKLVSLLLALVMLMALAVPAFAADEGGEGPAQELKALWLDWDEEGRNYVSADLLAAADRGEGGGFGLAPGNDARVIFYIWNHETQKREKFVVPEAGEGVSVEKLASDEIAKNAEQSQYYVRVTLDGWNDAELTADGLTCHVNAAMDDFAFFSSQDFSQETYLANDVNEETLTDCTVYFGNSYPNAGEDEPHDKVVSVEKMESGDENFYTVEKVSDSCWKIVYQDVFAVWGNIGVRLKLEVLQPDGETREDERWLWIVHESAPELRFLWIDGEWSDEEQRDVFWFNPERRDCAGSLELQPGAPLQGILGYGGDWDENGFNLDGFTPVSVKDVKVPEGIAVNTGLAAREGAQWSEYYVELSVDERSDKDFTITYGEYELPVSRRLPSYTGVYTAPEATWENWAGPWGFPFNAVLDNEYYIISTSSDAVHGRHATGLALSAEWDKENEEIANDGVELSKVSDGVYKLTLKDGALNRTYFHLELDVTWMDVAGNTYTDTNCYIGNFDINSAVVAAETPLYDGTAANAEFIPVGDAAGKITASVTMKAGEDKAVYLYRSGYSYSKGPMVYSPAIKGFYHSANEELTLTQDEADFTRFTLSADKAGTYEIYFGAEVGDYSTLKLFHADGTPWTDEEWAKFDEDILIDTYPGGVLMVCDDWDKETYTPLGSYVPFEEMFPGNTYTWELSEMDWGNFRLTVIVEPEVNFDDVPENKWFYADIKYVASRGLMNGTGETTFNPNGSVKREMVPTVLYRLDGQPEVKGGSFTDVAAGSWYANATAWGAENEIVKGMGNNTFGVGADITREQLAVMLYRYAEYKGCDMSASADLSGFADAKNVHSWAKTELQWAVGTGIMNGKGAGLDPQGTATRAELAAMLARFCRDVL